MHVVCETRKADLLALLSSAFARASRSIAAVASELWPFSCKLGICPSLVEDDGTGLRVAGTDDRLVLRLTGAGMLVIRGKV